MSHFKKKKHVFSSKVYLITSIISPAGVKLGLCKGWNGHQREYVVSSCVGLKPLVLWFTLPVITKVSVPPIWMKTCVTVEVERIMFLQS